MLGVGQPGRVHAGAFLPGLQVLTGNTPAAPVFAEEARKGLAQARAVRGLRHGRDCRREGQGRPEPQYRPLLDDDMTGGLPSEVMTTSGKAMTFLNMARKYQKAGTRLLESIEGDKADPQCALSDPMYFLFAHTLELAFKAFLLFRGEAIPMSGKAGMTL